MTKPGFHILTFALFVGTALGVVPGTMAAEGIGGTSGAFSRLGFGARGIGMGNAQTAVVTGDITGYYNPALIPFAEYRHVSATFGVLSLDRSLNFLGYSQPLAPRAGISVGIINSGVSDIDGRDSDGEATGPLRTSENQIFLTFGLHFKSNFALGITLKYYHNHLYADVTSTSVGVDLGILVNITHGLTAGATVKDINSEYQWDTGKIYGRDGSKTFAPFPKLYTIGFAYQWRDSVALIAGDLEFSSVKTLFARFGVEVPVVREFTIRSGIDRVDLKDNGSGVRPSFGFTVRPPLGDWTPAIIYSYVVEPFSPSGMHIISVSTRF
jgi:hypothetical protein